MKRTAGEKRNDTERLRRENRSAILQTLRNKGPIARIDLGKLISLSPAAVTAITKDLLSEGLLKEVESSDNGHNDAKRGRPRVLLDINGDAGKVIVVVASINQFDVHIADFRGDLLYHECSKLDFSTLDGIGFDRALLAAVQSLTNKYHMVEKQLLSIGVSMQGMVDSENGLLIWSPVLGFGKHDIAGPLSEHFNCPVELLNDANAITLSLRSKPENQQLNNFVCVMLGVGIGMGLFLNGRIYRGHFGSGSEFGHVNYIENGHECRCGGQGCIEAYISDYALYRDFYIAKNLPVSGLKHPSEQILKRLSDEARDGDAELLQWFDHAGKVLGTGLSQILNLLSPEKVIIAGPGVRGFDLMEKSMLEVVGKSVVEPLKHLTQIESEPYCEDYLAKGTVRRALISYYQP